jgi:thioredoxin 1
MSKAAAVTGAEWETEVEKSDVPVLVDFWATWCQPCLRLGPTLDQVAEEFAGKAKVVKVDVDQEQDLAVKYGVMQIPNLVFFKDGKQVDQVLGVVPKSVIADKLEKLLA